MIQKKNCFCQIKPVWRVRKILKKIFNKTHNLRYVINVHRFKGLSLSFLIKLKLWTLVQNCIEFLLFYRIVLLVTLDYNLASHTAYVVCVTV